MCQVCGCTCNKPKLYKRDSLDEAGNVLRKCKHCDIVKPIEEYYQQRKRSDVARMPSCKECMKNKRKALYQSKKANKN